MPHFPYAIVRDGRYLIAAGSSLSEALERAALTFYSGFFPPGLVILERGTEPLPSLAAIPCSEQLLLASADAFFCSAIELYEGAMHLEQELAGVTEEQLFLF